MAKLATEYRKSNTFWRKWGALFILLTLFVTSWGGQFVTQLEAEKLLAEQHGQEFQMSEFWPEFWSSTFENWQSEWLQLFVQALIISGLSSLLFRKQDEEHYKTQLMIEELRAELEALHPRSKTARRAGR